MIVRRRVVWHNYNIVDKWCIWALIWKWQNSTTTESTIKLKIQSQCAWLSTKERRGKKAVLHQWSRTSLYSICMLIIISVIIAQRSIVTTVTTTSSVRNCEQKYTWPGWIWYSLNSWILWRNRIPKWLLYRKSFIICRVFMIKETYGVSIMYLYVTTLILALLVHFYEFKKKHQARIEELRRD